MNPDPVPTLPGLRVAKAHAYGNDFLYVPFDDLDRDGRTARDLAVVMCDRHHGIGADGLICYRTGPEGVSMRLINSDGSPAEVSGNGVRGLAALLVAHGAPGDLTIATDAGPKRHLLVERQRGARFRFRTNLGQPTDIRRVHLSLGEGEELDGVRLWMGNPQFVAFAPLDASRVADVGRRLQQHPEFPEGVNVEFAEVRSPGEVHILICERGAGPTQSSGTGSSAAAVAAAVHAGANRDVTVVAPGGSQRVEWTDDGVWLTGWAEIVMEGVWTA